MKNLRILVADGSAMYKKMFAQAAAELDKNAAVVCVATGDEALEKIKLSNYEIIVIDAETLELDRILKKITLELPKAFVMITARPSPANNKICAEALDQGAADCLVKPIHSSYNENFDVIKRKMTIIFNSICKARGKKHDEPKAEREKMRKAIRRRKFHPEIVLVAASTGGPLALENMLVKLSKDFPVPILIVQHMLIRFTETLAQNLNQKSPLLVKTAENGEQLEAGIVYIAPGGTHMKVGADNKLCLEESPLINGVRPAADALFESVAEAFEGSAVLAIILTGMGRDGEKGLAALKEKKDCFCLAQSEKTCVVFGMPRVAIERGFADKVLDLDEIPFEMENFNYSSSAWEKDKTK